MVGRLFNSGGKLLQGLNVVLCLCFHLIEGPYGQVLVPKSVLSCPDRLLVCRIFMDSVEDTGSQALQGGKNVRGVYAWCQFIALRQGLYVFLIDLRLDL
jgi:hypothetical protein